MKAIFLDAGWTLIYPRRSMWEIFAGVAADAGGALTAGEAERMIHGMLVGARQRAGAQIASGTRFSDSDREFADQFRLMGRAVFSSAGLGDHAEPLTERFFEQFWEPGNWAVFADVPDEVARLRARGLQVGVLSNAATTLHGFLEHLGLRDCFDFLVISAVEGYKKPDARIFRRALEMADARPHEAVHVGDMFVEDILGARNVGLHHFLMDRGERSMFPHHPEADLHPAGSIEIVHDLAGVRHALEAL